MYISLHCNAVASVFKQSPFHTLGYDYARCVTVMACSQCLYVVLYAYAETALSGVVRRNYGCFGLNTGIQYGESGLS